MAVLVGAHTPQKLVSCWTLS